MNINVIAEQWDGVGVAVGIIMFILLFVGCWQYAVFAAIIYGVASILLFFKRRCSYGKR